MEACKEKMKLGKMLSTLTKKRGWTIAKLAREAGVPIQTVHGWTTGRAAVNLSQLKKVCEALQTPMHVLVFGEPDPHEGVIQPKELDKLFHGDVRVTIHRIQVSKSL